MSVAFETIVSEVKVFVEGHGRLPGKEEDNGLWIICQRRNHSQLSEVRIQLLESIPHWTWDPSGDAFATAVSEVKAFVEEHGRLPGKEENRGLWVNNQRTTFKKRKLSEDRIHALEAIPYWTWSSLRVGC